MEVVGKILYELAPRDSVYRDESFWEFFMQRIRPGDREWLVNLTLKQAQSLMQDQVTSFPIPATFLATLGTATFDFYCAEELS